MVNEILLLFLRNSHQFGGAPAIDASIMAFGLHKFFSKLQSAVHKPLTLNL